MKSAREIACSDDMAERGCFGGQHNAECDARTEAIQQAREDGARWALSEITHGRPMVPADVRNEAP